jgi:hypothetical protein
LFLVYKLSDIGAIFRDALNRDTNLSWQSMWSAFSFFTERLYFFSEKFFGELIGFPLFIALTTLVLLTVKLNYLLKMVGHIGLVCFFYTCLYLFLFEATVLRVAFATALVVPAFYYLREQRFIISVLLILLATQIQLTSIVFLLIYPLYFIRRLNVLVFAVFVISPMVVITRFSVFDGLVSITNLFTDKYQIYNVIDYIGHQNTTGLYFYFIGFFYLLIFALLYFLRDSWLNDPFKQTLLSLAMLAVILMCFFHDHVVVGARLGELLLISLVPLLSWLYLYFKDQGNKWASYGLLMMFSGYGMARFIYLFPSLIFH